MNGNGGAGAIWKTIALILVTILITGSPGMLYAIRTWTIAGDVELIRDRQDDVRTRLSIAESRVIELERRIEALETRLYGRPNP